MKKRLRRATKKKATLTKQSYVRRPSQITKRAPSKRLRKRRVKNITRPAKGRFPNPRPLLFIITAQKGSGKKMHFDGKNFSQRARISTFPTMSAAEDKAKSLLKQFSILRSYRVMIEPNENRKNFH